MRPRSSYLWRDERGAVAATYAIALMGLIVVAGVGYDYSRMASLDSELQNAADQAALAAATQLDRESETSAGAGDGACARASEAAVNLLRNLTLLSNDGNATGNQVTVTSEPACDATGSIRFYEDREKTDPATNDAEARFVEVHVNPRRAFYALTPVMASFTNSGDLNAAAYAGVGSAVCKVPPIMICSPDPTQPFNAEGRKGQGLIATGHAPNGTSNNQGGGAGSTDNVNWSPGNFGFLQVQEGTAQSRNARLLQALAFNNPPIDCVSVDDNKVNTGNPQGLYDAINTRFGIYDFPSSGNNTLASCQGGACSPAPNVRMDHATSTNGNGNGGGGNGNGNGNGNGGGGNPNVCKMGNNGYTMPTGGAEFNPIVTTPVNSSTRYDTNITRMGLPRDLCHYDTYSAGAQCGTVAGGRFGTGLWARNDYWAVNHNGVTRPTAWNSMTRYETYLWEIENSRGVAPAVCAPAAGDASRRVLTIAVVSNCAQLSGTSRDVVIDDWVDVFLVEPATDNSARHMGGFRDAIYFEIIGPSKLAGSGTYAAQQVRRDVPYLIQ